MNDLGLERSVGRRRRTPGSSRPRARAPGKGGAFYTTALSIGNRGSAEARYTMKFLGHDVDGTAGPESAVRPRPRTSR